MKIKRYIAMGLMELVFLCSVACQPPTQESSQIDNTAASQVHDKIYLYDENNVPYDEDDDCHAFCFMTPYLAPHPTGGAVLVFPGGGYGHLSNSTKNVEGYGKGVDNEGDQKEASSIVEWYNQAGISVFVVNYRTTAVDSAVNYKHILSDAARAMRLVRGNADKYYVDENKIAVQGYSAGGHLASMLLTKNSWEIDDQSYIPDEYDRIDVTPNAGVLCYAVISMDSDLTHINTRKNFTGGDESLYDYFSAEKNVSAQTAPCFLWCHERDATCKSGNTYAMASALDLVGVYNECYVYDDNGATEHGIGVAQEYEEAKAWPSLAMQFLKKQGF
ncbi:MAG: alpha/beta hydrolase [Clostridia bacterium]|nr:alpha/beta hydrolase [Clostridia bacterium]